ncbi:DUF6894 family protein [Faunimonas sp. B44]|uniref:DUF6894 family protein n=1 Tax=Faunimonas sp. B44 TaxID=3461493 RepID=UPI004044AC77
MPRFFFEFYERRIVRSSDPQGYELADLAAAHRQALSMIDCLTAVGDDDAGWRDWSIRIAASDGRTR